jgi:hypothetical protein
MPPRLIFIKENGEELKIMCDEVPPSGGTLGRLVISNVRRKQGDGYEYLSFERKSNGGPPIPDVDLILKLKGPLEEDSMIMPYNGGEPQNEVTWKLNY